MLFFIVISLLLVNFSFATVQETVVELRNKIKFLNKELVKEKRQVITHDCNTTHLEVCSDNFNNCAGNDFAVNVLCGCYGSFTNCVDESKCDPNMNTRNACENICSEAECKQQAPQLKCNATRVHECTTQFFNCERAHFNSECECIGPYMDCVPEGCGVLRSSQTRLCLDNRCSSAQCRQQTKQCNAMEAEQCAAQFVSCTKTQDECRCYGNYIKCFPEGCGTTAQQMSNDCLSAGCPYYQCSQGGTIRPPPPPHHWPPQRPPPPPHHWPPPHHFSPPPPFHPRPPTRQPTPFIFRRPPPPPFL